jgi:hypothetical protein
MWEDPLALDPINEERPELVEKYTAFLQRVAQTQDSARFRYRSGSTTAAMASSSSAPPR